MNDALSKSSGAVHGGVRVWLRLEGVGALLVAMSLYAQAGGSWLLFGVLFLVPDISFAGYLAGPRAGSVIYNVAHSHVGPLLLAAVALSAETQMALLAALVWAAHIGFDRALGYGLKYPNAFGDTHLGRIGRSAVETNPS